MSTSNSLFQPLAEHDKQVMKIVRDYGELIMNMPNDAGKEAVIALFNEAKTEIEKLSATAKSKAEAIKELGHTKEKKSILFEKHRSVVVSEGFHKPKGQQIPAVNPSDAPSVKK